MRYSRLGQLKGVVQDDNGLPVSEASVLFNNVREYSRDSMGRLIPTGVAINSGTRTGTDGSFAIAGLPAGRYYLCAFGTHLNDLSSCEWWQGSYPVELRSGLVVANVMLKVSAGALLMFQVRDPDGRIQDTAAGPPVNGRLPLSGGNFKIGVMAGGRYVRANLLYQQGAIRSYAVAVPKTASLRLFVATSLPISLPTGEPVEVGRPGLPISVAGQARLVVDLEVQ